MQNIGVYILKCANDRYYVGSTNNVTRRVQEHQNGEVAATARLLPVTLAFFQEYETVKRARQIEYKIKQKKSRVILERIIADGVIKII
jgi:putative endonuclease